MPHAFRVGDRVKCIDASLTYTLTVNNVYTIEEVSGYNSGGHPIYTLAGLRGYKFKESRFELEQPLQAHTFYVLILRHPDGTVQESTHRDEEVANNRAEYFERYRWQVLAKKKITVRY